MLTYVACNLGRYFKKIYRSKYYLMIFITCIVLIADH
jgi:hypothetical protein